MNTRHEHFGEPEQSEGLGKRVRRFVDSELSRFLDKDKREAAGGERSGHPDDPGSTSPGGADHEPAGTAHEPAHEPAGTAHEPGPTHASDVTNHPEPVAPDTGGHPSTAVTHDVGSAERVGLLNDVVGLRNEWQQVQGTFVDDPQRAVREASVLVDRTLEEIRLNVASGHPSEAMSTEDLRVSFQRYREFFQRLLSA
ncbi:MAG: hypothetical protein ACRDTA_19430 [Pseudonocardiaceae bacterium]